MKRARPALRHYGGSPPSYAAMVVIIQHLKLREQIACMCVCKDWRRIVYRVLRSHLDFRNTEGGTTRDRGRAPRRGGGVGWRRGGQQRTRSFASHAVGADRAR